MRTALLAVVAIAAALAGTGAVLYARNATPVVPAIATAEAAAVGTPWVVKLHAQWCPVCMLTKGMWAEIEQTYAGRVRLAVSDDGRGFEEPGGGHGLEGMRERARLLGGRLRVSSAPGRGTRVTLSVPLPEDEP